MKEIVKVADNDVEVRIVYYTEVTGGDPVVTSVDHYGIDKVLVERSRHQIRLTDWQSLHSNGVVEFQGQNVVIKIAKVQDDLDELDEIEIALNN